MKIRKEKIKKWIRRGNLAVEVEVEIIYSPDEPDTGYLEPKTIKKLDQIAVRAEAGDIPFLKKVGKVFELVEQ